MRNLNRPWTSEEEVRPRKLLEAGDSVLRVAAKFKRTPAAVRSRLRLLRIHVGKAARTERQGTKGGSA
jgi:hypothetical protein